MTLTCSKFCAKWMWFAVLGAGAVLATGCGQKSGAGARPAVAEAQAGETDAGAAVMNAALQASEADVGMLKDLSGRLEKACARNKYGLTEQECIDRLRAREDRCADQTAARFPGQLADTGRVQVVMNAYVGCIFEG